MSLFAFSASLRQGAWNTKLIERAVAVAQEEGIEIELVDFRDLLCPWYDEDVKNGEGFPPGADLFRDLLTRHDGFLIASPEYNYSMPGALKNTIDWASRYRPSQPLAGKHAMLLSASPSMVGGNRGLWQLRQPLEVCGVHVHPEMFSLAVAHEAFDDDSQLADPALAKRLRDAVVKFSGFAHR